MGKSTAFSIHDTSDGLGALELDLAKDGFELARRLETPIWVFDIDLGCIAYANNAACQFWRADTEQELCGRDMMADMSQTVSQRLKQYQQDFRKGDNVFHEMWTLYPDGTPKNVMVYFRGYRFEDGRMGMLCEISGEAKSTPENLRSAEALLHTDVMIGLYGLSTGAPLYLNPAARNLQTAVDHHLSDLFHDPADFADMLVELQLREAYNFVAQTSTRLGQRWHDLSAKLCSDAVTGEKAILLTAVDVSDLKIARDTAHYLADRDQLTGCFNRTYLQNHIADFVPNNDEVARCTLAYFDVDRFKLINDVHGHEVGDTVLKTIAARVMGVIRASDVLVRLGGDEFVIILHQQMDTDQVMPNMERIRNEIARPIWLQTVKVDLDVSMGVSQFNPADCAFTDVMREADLALYAAKSRGRGRVVMFDTAMGEAARARDELELDLKKALDRREFVLHYQPRFAIDKGQVVAAEGLLRWAHPTKGLVMPDKFISICEETGLIEDLGQQVLEVGCEQARQWNAAGLERQVSLNISPRQFRDERLVSTLRHFANQSGFPAEKVELEITENVLIGDPDEIAEKLRRITLMGYRIAIDDFGTGYSNLSYISRFPVHCIKIDRTFVDQLPGSAPIVSLILTLARQIGATIVAEGVETEEQMQWLNINHCDEVQGYLISKAVPQEEFERVVSSVDRLKP